MEKNKILNILSGYNEMNPDKHDGSYELVRETVRAYLGCSEELLDYNDLNLLYLMAVGTWKHGYAQKEKCINLSNLSLDKKEYLISVLNRVKDNAENNRYEYADRPGSVGMFGTGFYSFVSKTDKDSVKRFFKLCLDILPLDDDNDIYSIAEKALSVKIKGMKTSSASIVLHCLKPFTFPILNGIMGNDNAFSILGVDISKTGETTEYIANCRKIKQYRDANFKIKNYRIFDLAVWYHHDIYTDKINGIIKAYKADFSTRDAEERYKWKAVGTYKKLWDIDAPNFASMLKSALSDTKNLLRSGNYFPYKMLCIFAEEEPEKVRSLFRILYEEELPLEERILRFKEGFETHYQPRGVNHYQDLHAISVYLTCEFPEKYYIYKYTVVKEFIKKIQYRCDSIDVMSDFEKMELLLSLYDVVLEVVKQDNELQGMSKSRLDDSCYRDDALHMLTHDVVYFGQKYDSRANYWPSIDEYNPGITVEMWKEILADKTLTSVEALDMLAKMLQLGGESTCYHLAEVFGKTHSYYNATGSNFGKRVKECYQLPDCYDSESDRIRYYVIPFVGRNIVEDGKSHYSWKLRDELKEALESMDIAANISVDNQCQFDKNIILYGPPGTGKTYNTAIYAVAIIENKSLEEVSEEDYSAVMKRYNDYKKQGRIEFTTFHQSFGYEEFIEGIKPVVNEDSEDGNTTVTYDVIPGVFKEFCDRTKLKAITNQVKDYPINENPNVWKVSLEGTGDNLTRKECLENGHIRIGWDFYGESITEETDFSVHGGKKPLNAFMNRMRIGDIVLSCYSATTIDAIGIVTGEYEWHDEYEHFKRLRKVNWLVKDIKENIMNLTQGTTMTLSSVYRFSTISVDDVFKIVDKHSVSTSVDNSKDNRYVFIIDEINRGNISKILGELITLIEPTKRLGQQEEMQVKLPYSKKEFGVPDNVYIIGTMNTADRSIAAIDTALRRRFSFKEMLPKADVLDGVEVDGVSITKVLEMMNKRIEVLYDREHTIGHAYFMPLKDNNSIDTLADIFKNKIIPLLQEYFYEDYDKIMLVLGDNQKTDEPKFIIKDSVNEIELFGEDTDIVEDAYKYTINEEAFNDISAYKKMI